MMAEGDLGSTLQIKADEKDNVILLTGAGASAFLGLPTLESIVDDISISFRAVSESKVEYTIQKTWNRIKARKGKSATFEELIAKLKTYLEAANLLAEDNVFKDEVGHLPPKFTTGEFQQVWKDAISKCYQILLDLFAPQKINSELDEFKIIIDLLKKLTTFNYGRLHIFTTNYDCSYNVMASKSNEVSFITHIDNNEGTFRDKWYTEKKHLIDLNKPLLYIHRLHGCVGWFSKPEAPYGLEEILGAGEKLEIKDDNKITKMCLKLISTDAVGTNPAFRLAFNEFYHHLRLCKVLLIWGHSFRDVEVLRTIKNAIGLRADPFDILYIDPYLEENMAKQNIRDTLSGVPIGVKKDIELKRIDWVLQDGIDKLIKKVIEAIEEVLQKGGTK